MAKDYEIGQAAARSGWKAPPPADHHIKQEQRDAGYNRVKNAPPPPPPKNTKDS